MGTESTLVEHGELSYKLSFVTHSGVLVDKQSDLLRRRVVCDLLSRIS